MRGVAASTREEHDFLHRAFAFCAFTLLLTFDVTLESFKFGGLPVRAILSVGLLAAVVVIYPEQTRQALRKYMLLLGLAAGLAIEGVFVSAVNGTPIDTIIQAVVEVHLQAAITVVAAVVLAQVCGARACVWGIILVIGASACVAVLQLLHLHQAWDLRRALGPFAQEDLLPGEVDRRPMGLAFSPIQLATQLCLAFAAYTAVRDKVRQPASGKKTADPMVILALMAFVAMCIATATRSPILGGVLFFAVYAAQRRNGLIALIVVVGGLFAALAGPLLLELIQSEAPRVVQADDNSVAARLVFVYYGSRLFLDNPLGYGLAFDPPSMWGNYWSDLYMMRAAQGAQIRDLHNFVLTMLNTYGIGILLLVPFAVKLLRRASASLIFFIPYGVHIIFHNSGPFYNDTIIWFVVAAVSAAQATRTFASPTRRVGVAAHPRFGLAQASYGRRAPVRPSGARLLPR